MISPQKEPVAVIFAGGSGKRLWPISTSDIPKQLNTTFSKRTLIGEAFDRIKTIFPTDRIVVVTTEVLVDKIKEIISLPDKNWIVQPKNVDTAAAMCLTALHLETLFPESVAVLFYSDHKIIEPENFKKVIKKVQKMASEYTSLITVGTKPTEPNTQFGYIELGERQTNNHLFKVASFKEKPDEVTAQKYLNSGNYVWNTGVYSWQTSSLLEIVKAVAPTFYKELLSLRVIIGEPGYAAAVKAWFDRITPIAFEKAISEKLPEMMVYVGDYEWEDIGNWKTVYELAKKDKHKNAILEKEKGQEIDFVEATGNMVLAQLQHVALVGVEDIIVIQTDDSLLVCHKDHVGEVKKVV